MHLKKVTLNNFRCFEHLEVPLHPRLTVLVAENGGGKTSILDAIAVGLSPVLKYLSSVDQRLTGPGIKDADFRLTSGPHPERAVEPDLFSGLGDPSLEPKRTTSDRILSSEYAQIIMEAVDGPRWDNWRPASEGKAPETRVGQGDLMAYAASLLQSFKDSRKLFPVFAYYGAKRGWIVVPERLRESKVNYEHPISALLGALDSLSDFAEMLKWFDVVEASELRANREKNGSEEEHSPSLETIRTAISSLLGGDFINPRFNKRHKFVVQARKGPSELQVTQLSQGYQSMLALGMDFARRLALANGHLDANSPESNWAAAISNIQNLPPGEMKDLPERGPSWAPALMLVDEIDLHLHPSWQQRVLQDLLRAFPGTQFIVTSHSPQVLSTVPQECIVIVKDGEIHSAPLGTDGAEVQRILESVFGVSRRPKTKMSEILDEYLRMVDNREWNSARALELRSQLDKWSGGEEPSLQEADLQIENLKWEAGE
jgi:predicted ATP-binding protein involved in virulence